MLVLLALLLPTFAVAQEQTPTFRTGVSSVLVDTLALDSDGNPVSDLTVDDFEIYEDDVRQTIQSFDVTDWTSYVAAKTTAAPGSSGGSSINTYPRRFIFIFNRQGAEFDWLVRAKRALNEFVVESMADGDEAMVIDVGFSTKVTQQLQASKEETLESIRKLVPMVVPYPMGPDRAAGFLYQNLEALGKDLAQIPGRKVIVLLSNELLTFTGPGSRRSNEGFALRDAVESLNQANTSVYTIDLRGARGRSTMAGGLSPLTTETGGRYFSQRRLVRDAASSDWARKSTLLLDELRSHKPRGRWYLPAHRRTHLEARCRAHCAARVFRARTADADADGHRLG